MDNVFFSSTWKTVTTFNTLNKHSSPINFFIKSNEDGTETIYKDDLTILNEEELLMFNKQRQTGSGEIITKDEFGFLSEDGFDEAVDNLTLAEANKDKDIGRLDQYTGFKWSYTTSTSGLDLLVRYLSNLSLPVPFIDIALKNDEEWGKNYDNNDSMKTFNNNDNINNIIELYFKIKDPPIKINKTPNNIKILKKILNARIVISSNSGPRRIIQGLLLKYVSCINENCFRYARSGPDTNSGKMRQECGPCTDREADSDKLEGISLVPLYNNNKEFLGKYDLDDINYNIKFVCPRFCNNSETQYKTDSIPWKKLNHKKPRPIQYDNEKKQLFDQYLTNKKGVEFFCPVQPDKYEIMNSGAFQIDHINGNHWDNSYKNVQTLCSICHDLKSSLAGDKGTKKDDTITSTINEEINKYMNSKINKKTKIKNKNDIRHFDSDNLYLLLENILDVYRTFCIKNKIDQDNPFFEPDDEEEEEVKEPPPPPPPVNPKQEIIDSIDSYKNIKDLKNFYYKETDTNKLPKGFGGKTTLSELKSKIKNKLRNIYRIS